MTENKTLQERAATLPEKIKAYLFSIKAAEINAQIFIVAGLEAGAYLELSKIIAEIILKNIPVASLEEKIGSLVSWPSDKISSLAIEIAGSRLLVCDDWLGGEVEKYLRSKNVDISRYAALVAEQQVAVAKEEAFFREQIEEDPEEADSERMKDVLDDDFVDEDNNEDESSDAIQNERAQDFDVLAKKKSLITLLREGVINALQTSVKEIENYNYLFVRVWSEDEGFHIEAQNSLMANQEKISNAKIEIDGRVKTATISGLLKNFVKKYGLDANDLNIAEYVSSSELKDFSDDEKALSLRILKFFRNINKLDEYLAQQVAGQIEGFEVLPLSASPVEDSSVKSSQAKSQSVEPVQTKTAPVKPASVGLAAELEMMLQDYAPGSLEYKTLQQELKRLAQKK